MILDQIKRRSRDILDMVSPTTCSPVAEDNNCLDATSNVMVNTQKSGNASGVSTATSLTSRVHHIADDMLRRLANGSSSRLQKISKFSNHAFRPRLPATPSGHVFRPRQPRLPTTPSGHVFRPRLPATSSDLLFEPRLDCRVQIRETKCASTPFHEHFLM